jgi:two-component system, OmpR family, phosphate regulon response regulator PhoB
MSKLVLVVDDEPDITQFFSTVLSENGYRTVCAADGVEAMRMVRAERPDLVMLDITMPEQSGVRTYRELRTDPELGTVPVLIVTGIPHDFKQFISTRRKVPPPDGYLEKPVTAADLLAEVRRIIG